MTSVLKKTIPLWLATALLGFSGCGGGEIDNEEIWDEGPPPEEAPLEPAAEPEGSKADEGQIESTVLAITSGPSFQLPFPCGQVWSGQTRTNHSPQNSVDFNRNADEGDVVVAAAAGTVSRVENLGSRSYGRWIEIDHGNGWKTRYAHLSVQRVSRGQRVAAGQTIGNVGNTGGSTGAHLHHEQIHNGVAVRMSFNGTGALYFGSRSYTSKNACGGGGGGTTGVPGRVDTAGAGLTVRSGPGTSFPVVGSVADGATVRIKCQKRGQSISGTFGTTTLWDNIGSGFVSDAYISTGSDGQVAPTCP
jgi:murein DD-endopeptidase MepM/ murein hydrolase activator NlpD